MEEVILATVEFVQEVDYNKVFFVIGLGIVIFWLSVAVWVFRDARSRYKSIAFPIIFALMSVIFSVFGYLAYVVLRPKDTLEDKYWHEREKEFLTHEIGDYDVCPNCHYDQIFVEFLMCPKCGHEIRHKCEECAFALNNHWKHCPSCGKTNPHFDEKLAEHPEHVLVGDIEKKDQLVANDKDLVQELALEQDPNLSTDLSASKPDLPKEAASEDKKEEKSSKKNVVKVVTDGFVGFFGTIGSGINKVFSNLGKSVSNIFRKKRKKDANLAVNKALDLKENADGKSKSSKDKAKLKEKSKKQKKRKRKAKKNKR